AGSATTISPMPPACSSGTRRSPTRSNARGSTAAARSTRSAPSRPAAPGQLSSRRSSSRSPAPIDGPPAAQERARPDRPVPSLSGVRGGGVARHRRRGRDRDGFPVGVRQDRGLHRSGRHRLVAVLNAAPAATGRGLRGEIGAMAGLAWPLILGGFAQMAINTVDVLILGRYDVAALAASALALNLLWAMVIFGLGVVTAAAPLIAAERGRRPHSVRDVRRTVRQAGWTAAFVCLPIWLATWHAEALFALLGQEPALSRAAAGFLRIAMWGALPFLLYAVLRLYVTALERPIWGLVVTLLGVAFNALSCWTLVFGHFGFPALGLTGAAIAN